MVYKFYIVSDEVANFKRVIAIDADDNFFSLRNAILDSVGYKKDQMESFFICDDDWTKEKEVTLADMGSESDEDIWIMDETPISELIEEDGQKLIFVFDYLNDRSFFMEMKTSVPMKNLKDPVCEIKIGKPAEQILEDKDFTKTATNISTSVNDFDDDFYGSETFNADELDPEGFEDMDPDQE